jgi:hypothetical protein
MMRCHQLYTSLQLVVLQSLVAGDSCPGSVSTNRYKLKKQGVELYASASARKRLDVQQNPCGCTSSDYPAGKAELMPSLRKVYCM